FPLNDDWSYAQAVRSLLITGHIRLSEWTFMTLVGQVSWGALFCLPFGFSYTALRLSTLVAGLLGVWATYGTLRAAGARPAQALLGALAVAGNPIYFSLAQTFMTDVPAYAVGMASVWLFVRGLEKESKSDLLAASLLAAWASLIRQTGVLIPVAATAAVLLKEGGRLFSRVGGMDGGDGVDGVDRVDGVDGMDGAGSSHPSHPSHFARPARPSHPSHPSHLSSPKRFSRGWTALLFPAPAILALAGHALWMRHTGQAAPYSSPLFDIAYLAVTDRLRLLGGFCRHALSTALYLGAFTAPLWIEATPRVWKAFKAARPHGHFALAAGALAFCLAFQAALEPSFRMPALGNILYNVGAGPLLLRDTSILNLPHWPAAPAGVWIAIRVVGAIGAGLALPTVVLLLIRIGRAFADAAGGFLLLLLVLHASALALQPLFFDRHVLFSLPLLMAVALRAAPSDDERPPPRALKRTTAGYVLAVLVFAFAIGATHDYLAWNRARWKALDWLMETENVSPTRIDGGFEFNGSYLYDPSYQKTPEKSWWWVVDDEYALAFGPIKGYAVERREPFRRWAPPGRGEILVLKRAGGSE
ncbi:MAG: glycosyltransferase family 39 protein, partial [Candidatus Sumerlaeota bacterium]|nr:glycosyltransferase family 39 protein [Candidatus Sumerlaeota bacterium]